MRHTSVDDGRAQVGVMITLVHAMGHALLRATVGKSNRFLLLLTVYESACK